jgi:hypothetical protein
MRPKTLFSLLFVCAGLIVSSQYISCKPGTKNTDSLGIAIIDTTLSYESYNYPATKNPLISFSVMPLGIIMLPLQGGIYIPNFDT